MSDRTEELAAGLRQVTGSIANLAGSFARRAELLHDIVDRLTDAAEDAGIDTEVLVGDLWLEWDALEALE